MMINNYIRGGQVFLHKIRMFKQVWDKSIIVSLAISLIISAYLSYGKFAKLDYHAGVTYVKAIITVKIDQVLSKTESSRITASSKSGVYKRNIKATEVLKHPGYKQKYYEIISLLQNSLLTMLGIMGATFVIVLFAWTRFGRLAKEKDIIKEGKIFSAAEVKSYLKKHNKASKFIVGGMPLVKDSETSHILITGTTGSGKTTCMNEILFQVRSNNHPAVIVDHTGEMTKKYYDAAKGDIIIGSHRESENEEVYSWDFWEDVNDEDNLAIIANTLFADKGGGYDEMWNNASKQFFKDAVKCIREEAKTNLCMPKIKDLYNLLARDKLQAVSKKLKNYPAGSMIDPGNEKTAMSIRTNTIAFIDWMENFQETDKKCSIKHWFKQINSTEGKASESWLFLRASPKQRVALRNFHSMLLDLSINQLMELGVSNERRIWMVIDELPALKKLPSIPPALSEFRKYGGCIMASVQSPHQLFDIYGQSMGYSMLDQFNTKFVFRTDEHNFASYLCKGLGDVEYKESSENYSYGSHEMRDGVSISMIEKKKPIITPSDLASLANLEAYVKLPESQIKVAKIKVAY